jgi:uncharacterized protein (TIGR03435 family)
MKWLGVLLLCGTAAGQTGPKFDAASIKPGVRDEYGVVAMATRPTLTPRRLLWQTDLYYLNSFAWNLPFDRISGLHSDAIFRIEATTIRDATVDEMRQMTRTLLARRFKEKAHMISKDVEGAALILEKSGLRVKEAELPANDRPYVVGTVPGKGITLVTSHHGTIDELAEKLALFLHQPVWNRTGLTGTYDYTLRYSEDNDPAVDAPSLEYALRNTLGINLLKKQTGPVDFLVIDSMETDPGEN